MQPAIHQEKNPDIYRFDVRLFVAMYCGLHLLFIIPRESPCIQKLVRYATCYTLVWPNARAAPLERVPENVIPLDSLTIV
jgi:hypothetical protein